MKTTGCFGGGTGAGTVTGPPAESAARPVSTVRAEKAAKTRTAHNRPSAM